MPSYGSPMDSRDQFPGMFVNIELESDNVLDTQQKTWLEVRGENQSRNIFRIIVAVLELV